MHRRLFLTGSGSLLVSLSGCLEGDGSSGNTSSDNTGNSDTTTESETGPTTDEDGTDTTGENNSEQDPAPAQRLKNFHQALQNENYEEADSYLHEHSSIGSQGPEYPFVQHGNSVNDVSVVQQNDDVALVQIELNTDESSNAFVRTEYIILRSNEQWNVYKERAGEAEPPRVSWDTSEQVDSEQEITAVEFEHGGGSTISPPDAKNLSIVVSGSTLAAPEGPPELRTGGRVLVPFDSQGETVNQGAEVRLVWSGFLSEDSATISSHTTSAQASGMPSDQFNMES